MKDLLVINTHSFVDLITNSSSELFVCNTKKTVEMVKTLLTDLIEAHNRFGDTKYSFSSCFGDVKEAKFTFDFQKFDKDVVNLYDQFCERFGRYYGEEKHHPLYHSCKEKEEQLAKDHQYYKIHRQKEYDDRTDAEKKELELLWKDYREKTDEIWTPYGVEKGKNLCDLFVEFLKLNSFSEEDINLVKKLSKSGLAKYKKDKCGQYVSLGFLFSGRNKLPDSMFEALEFFCEAECWSMTIEKGNILVSSNGDNSIPYELFELISSYLSASRHHLG